MADDGEYYLPGKIQALTDDEVEAMQVKEDEYLQKEASVREILYETVSETTFMQIKNHPTSAACWAALAVQFEDKGEMTKLDTLTKLQNARCSETDNVRVHIGNMSQLKEELAGMGAPVTDMEFATNLRRSLPPSFRPLLRSVDTVNKISAKQMTSYQLIQLICEEADLRLTEK